MTNDISIIDGQTNIKQNYASHDNEEYPHNLIFKSKVKLWQKITRNVLDGTEVSIIIPFDTYIEPFYNEEDINTTNSTGIFDSANNTYKLYSHTNGNYKTLESEYISFQRDRVVDSVTMTVKAEDTDGNETTKFDTYIYNGNEWISIKPGFPISFIDYNGVDLDADLDADLSGQYSNLDEEGLILFQNKLKFKIIRNTDDEVILKRIIIKLTWKTPWQDILPDQSPGFPTAWETWGYN